MTDWNFAAVWRGIAAAAPEREAFVCGDRRVTFGQFDDRARRLAWHLAQEAELERGDKVAIDVLNSPEYLETFFAALKLGCVPLNVNYRYLADEVHYVVDNSDAKAVLPADYTFGAADLGTHVLSITLKTAGNHSVTATDTASGTITGKQGAIAVTWGAVSR